MQLGLIGKSLQHSFSRDYFLRKFTAAGLHHHSYSNFELQDISEFADLLKSHPDLRGLNVTIPYKTAIIPYLDQLSAEAKEIGAVNTVKISNGKTKGYNTDVYGFGESLKPLLTPNQKQALILGTGGASLAVAYVLHQLGISYKMVSRQPVKDQISYAEATEDLSDFPLVINTTPLGTFPDVKGIPPLGLDKVTENHLFYDLVYNPSKTRFLQEAERSGARIKNGSEMLALQAEKAWVIWNEF